MSNATGSTETTDNFASGFLSFSGLQAVQAGTVPLSTVFRSGTSASATFVAAGANTVGATDLTKFDWTLAKKTGTLTDDF